MGPARISHGHSGVPSRPPLALLALLLVAAVSSATVAAGGDVTDGAGRLDAQALAGPGPYEVEAREVVVERAEDEGGDFDARLFIPLARPGGDDGADARAIPGGASPVVAFGHGYLTAVGLYESTLRHLATWGITTIAPRSGGELFPDHAAFAADLADAAASVERAASEPDWPGLPVDGDALALSGHSMGGGAAVLAAATDGRIDAVATLAAADTDPSSIEAAAELTVPALFIAGSDDGLTPVEAHQRPMFEATAGIPAQLRIIEGGSHCGFLDDAILVGLICDASAIAVEQQRALTRAGLTAWLRHELTGDPASAEIAWPSSPMPGVGVELAGTAATP